MAQGHYVEPVGPERSATPVATLDEDRPLRELVATVWENVEKLIRQELQLAVADASGRLDHAKKELSGAAIGGAVMYAGALAILAAVILLLATVMVAWLAALLVGAASGIFGFMLMQKAKKDLEAESLVPQRSAQSVRRDVEMFKEATK